MPPQIALITPVYNCAHLLPATLDSILAQTYPNFELLILSFLGKSWECPSRGSAALLFRAISLS